MQHGRSPSNDYQTSTRAYALLCCILHNSDSCSCKRTQREGFESKSFELTVRLNIDVQVINKFLRISDQSSKSSGNAWSLIFAHSQTNFDRPTTYPISDDTATTFTDATFDDLGAFCSEHFDPEKNNQQPRPQIVHDGFVVMDERTLKDETVVLVKWEFWRERIDPESLDDSDEAFKDMETWADVRLPFREAADTADAVGEDFLVSDMKCYLKEEDDGVAFRKR